MILNLHESIEMVKQDFMMGNNQKQMCINSAEPSGMMTKRMRI